MSNQSIIEHKANMYYVEFREDYLLICQRATYKKQKSKASPYCKALILAILEHWTNDKRGKGNDLAIFMTYPQWMEAMYGMYGRTVVIDSLEELIGEGLISKIPFRIYGKDSFKYLLNSSEINKRMRLLEDRSPDITRPLVDASTNKPVASTSKPYPSISKPYPSISKPYPSISKPYPSKSGHIIDSIDSPTHRIDDSSPQGSGESDTTPPNVHTLNNNLAKTQDQQITERNTSPNHANMQYSNVQQVNNPTTITLSPEEKRIFDLFCQIEIRPNITSKVKAQCAKLAPDIRTLEDMKSLHAFALEKLGDVKNKRLFLGNLDGAVGAWKNKVLVPASAPTMKNYSDYKIDHHSDPWA